MKIIRVDGRELPAVEIVVDGERALIWPPPLARKVEARVRAQRRQVYDDWTAERREPKWPPRSFGDPFVEICSTSK
jgi:hypothetical protein